MTCQDDSVAIAIANHCVDHPLAYEGMGVGSLIARTIVGAHGGRLSRVRTGPADIAHIVTLPRAGDPA